MGRNTSWSRREFLSTAGAAGLALTVRELHALAPGGTADTLSRAKALVYVGRCSAGDPGSGCIEYFRMQGRHWEHLGAIDSPSPRALALHPRLPVLYAVHNVPSHLGLPRGSVSAYRLDKASGALALWSTVPLLLSAICPQHLAISPDGAALLVSSPAGGSYNLLSLSADGNLQRTPYALKQTGCGPHVLQGTAQPRAAGFHSSGQAILSCDFGADRVDHLTHAEGELAVAGRYALPSGAGPAHLAMHPRGSMLLVSSELRPTLAAIPLDSASGTPTAPASVVAIDAWKVGPVAFSLQGDRAYVAAHMGADESAVAVYDVSGGVSKLRRVMTAGAAGLGVIHHMQSVEGRLLLAGTHGVAELPVYKDGSLGAPLIAASAKEAVSLAVLPLRT